MPEKKVGGLPGGTHQSAFYIEPTWLSHSELAVTNIHPSLIAVIKIFFKGFATGAPLSRGAPCHGIIGILVNPALMLSGKLFQTEAAECLKPRDANTVEVELLQIKFFDDDLSVRTGS